MVFSIQHFFSNKWKCPLSITWNTVFFFWKWKPIYNRSLFIFSTLYACFFFIKSQNLYEFDRLQFSNRSLRNRLTGPKKTLECPLPIHVCGVARNCALNVFQIFLFNCECSFFVSEGVIEKQFFACFTFYVWNTSWKKNRFVIIEAQTEPKLFAYEVAT